MLRTLGPTCVVGRRLAMVPAIDGVIRNLLSAFQILHATAFTVITKTMEWTVQQIFFQFDDGFISVVFIAA